MQIQRNGGDPTNLSTSIVIKKATTHGSPDKIGIVIITISTKGNKITRSKIVQRLVVFTPNFVETYINKRGKYVLTFTLDDESEYYGEFTVR